MPDTINVHKEVSTVEVNLIPMHIQYSGPANTAEFWDTSKADETNHDGHVVKSAYFRGCRLLLTQVPLDYDGVIVNKSEGLDRDDENPENVVSVNRYESVARFNTLNVYGHDAIPDPFDQWLLVNEWKAISDVIHGAT